MAEQFYTILTQIGKASIANASALGTKVEFKYFALGDGNGSYYNPTETQTSLKNEVWRGQIAQITVDEKNPNWIVLETVIPSNVGGFTIREAGVFDTEGNLLAVGKYPETYKPVVADGSVKDLYIRMILEVSNTSAVTLKIDPTVILATKKDIELLEQKMDSEIEGINIPVKSVNQKTGNVVLNATDVGAETPQASQEKANKALNAAKSYTDEVAVTLTDDLNTHKNQKSSTSIVGHVQLNDTVTSTSKTLAATANAVKTAYDKAKSVEDLANGLGDKIGILNGSGEVKEKANKIDLDTLRSRSISTGTGLSGGGDLSQDRVLSVLFGTTSTTVARGNHTHDAADISGTAKVVSGSYIGNNANNRTISLGFTPKFVFIAQDRGGTESTIAAIGMAHNPPNVNFTSSSSNISRDKHKRPEVVSGGFLVSNDGTSWNGLNSSDGGIYYYVAIG
ncbi:phage tail protein [Tissierella praeacuta]|uniref:phage tail protein n=1 Tax=Tissierella praeacuta TaxID=43131 RepID=UPI002FD94513